MAEFNIRLFAFKRISRDKELLFREVAWNSYISSNLDYKKMAKTKQQLWKIGDDNNKSKNNIDKMKEAIRKAKDDYNNRPNK